MFDSFTYVPLTIGPFLVLLLLGLLLYILYGEPISKWFWIQYGILNGPIQQLLLRSTTVMPPQPALPLHALQTTPIGEPYQRNAPLRQQTSSVPSAVPENEGELNIGWNSEVNDSGVQTFVPGEEPIDLEQGSKLKEVDLEEENGTGET
jgi:hypothetical protein